MVASGWCEVAAGMQHQPGDTESTSIVRTCSEFLFLFSATATAWRNSRVGGLWGKAGQSQVSNLNLSFAALENHSRNPVGVCGAVWNSGSGTFWGNF